MNWQILDDYIETLNLNPWVRSRLVRQRYKGNPHLHSIRTLCATQESEILRWRGCDIKVRDNIKQALAEEGLELNTIYPDIREFCYWGA